MIAVEMSGRQASEIFIGTRDGMAIRFDEERRPVDGAHARTASAASQLRDDDAGGRDGGRCAPGGTILSVTEQGYGKRTELEEYRVQSRGGVGIINIQTSAIATARSSASPRCHDDDELMLITQQGKILRMASKDIRTIGRATQGVRLIDIEETTAPCRSPAWPREDEDAANGTAT